MVKLEDVRPGEIIPCDVDSEPVAVANVEGKLFAFSNVCTHVGCLLSDGSLEGQKVTCPCHGSQFDVTSGAVIAGPAKTPIKTFAVEDVMAALRGKDSDPPSAAEKPAASATTVLRNVPLFSGLGKESLEALEAFMFRKTFKPGELIVEEGRTANGLYVILSGRVEVVKGLATPRPQLLTTLEAGEPFGEMALLGEWKRTASVRALDECECVGMDRWVFLAYLEREPQLAIKMLQFLAQRLADMDERLMAEE